MDQNLEVLHINIIIVESCENFILERKHSNLQMLPSSPSDLHHDKLSL